MLEASRKPEELSEVSDSAGGVFTSQASFSAVTSAENAWWQVRGSWPTDDGGSLVSPSLLLGHGLDDSFPTGVYMISIHAVDEHGIQGSSLVGAQYACPGQHNLPGTGLGVAV